MKVQLQKYVIYAEKGIIMSIKINEQIAKLRKQKEITQEELAVAIGVTNQAVSKWESGQCCPDIQLLPDIAKYFGISIDELMGVEAPKKEIKDSKQDMPTAESDPLFESALNVLSESGKVTASLLQRKLQIGYGRAKKIIDLMIAKNYISENLK